MREIVETFRAAVEALERADRTLGRFGAGHHLYRLDPPLASLAGIEATLGTSLPDDLALFAREVGSGGAGPYYGILPLERAAHAAIATSGGPALPVSHLGCGYVALVMLGGPHRGEVWLDARAVGLVRPIHPSFTAYYIDWIDRVARARWLEGYVPSGVCPLAGILGGYLSYAEERLGLAAGTIAGDDLRDVLEAIPSDAIEIGAQGSPLFDDHDRVDPCVVCARMLENLAKDGLTQQVVRHGVPPRPQRPDSGHQAVT